MQRGVQISISDESENSQMVMENEVTMLGIHEIAHEPTKTQERTELNISKLTKSPHFYSFYYW